MMGEGIWQQASKQEDAAPCASDSQAWPYLPAAPALKRQKPEYQEFKVFLNYITSWRPPKALP